MIKYVSISIIILFLAACGEGVQKKKVSKENEVLDVEIPVTENILDLSHKVIEEQKVEGGIVIQWYQKGKGKTLMNNEMVRIDYKVRLKDSTIVDGNYLVKQESLPFIIGYGMQTRGWDIAFRYLKVGDFVKIKLPAKLARGKIGFGDKIPKDAENYLTVRILSKIKPDLVDGATTAWLIHSDSSKSLTFNEKNMLLMHCLASTPNNRFFTNSYEKKKPFGVSMKDPSVIKGLKKSLKNRKMGDHVMVIVNPEDAYGTKGLKGYVSANEPIFYDIHVVDVF